MKTDKVFRIMVNTGHPQFYSAGLDFVSGITYKQAEEVLSHMVTWYGDKHSVDAFEVVSDALDCSQSGSGVKNVVTPNHPFDTKQVQIKLVLTSALPWMIVSQNYAVLFYDKFEKFKDFYTAKQDYSEFIDKLVRFTYKGGSKTGSRVVLVKEYRNGLLVGKDAHKDAWRSYRICNIQGKIEVIS